jgi:hypothetical protein
VIRRLLRSYLDDLSYGRKDQAETSALFELIAERDDQVEAVELGQR